MNKKGNALNRAAVGDEVWVVLNHVNPDQWEVHKEFVINILIPAARKVVPSEMGHTRYLHSAEPNEDGTYTSVFLMDPVIQGGNYDIPEILKKAHGDEQGEAYLKQWTESLASPQVGFGLKQSPW